jgi:hypothetical protein
MARTPKPAAPAKKKLPTIDAHQLRELADAASSLRKPGGDPIYGVVKNGELTIKLGPRKAPAGALFEVDTSTVEVRPPVRAVIVECEGTTVDLVNGYDAVFWSEAAVEKFVLPYYASKSLWEAAAVLTKLSYYWYGQVPPDTDPDPTVRTTFTETVRANSTEVVPFALAHTPDSDFTPLAEGPTKYNDLHLLVKTAEGVHFRALSSLPDPPRHPRLGHEASDRARRTPAKRGGA